MAKEWEPEEELDETTSESHVAEPLAEELPAEELPAEEPKPEGLTKQIESLLLAGVPEDDIVAQGYNPNSIRIVAYDLEKTGRRKRPSKALKTVRNGSAAITKPSPPEALVESMQIPNTVPPSFEQGMKFGMSCIVIGVRLAQEMSSIGVQQAKPLVEMARDMRAGEQAAAKSATIEAAGVAAEHVGQTVVPFMQSMDNRLRELEYERPARPASDPDNPLRGMMAGMVENLFKTMGNKMMPGMMGESGPASGWSRRKE